ILGLFGGLVQPHLAENDRRVDDRMRWICSFQSADALRMKIIEYLLVKFPVVCKLVIEPVVPIEQFLQISPKLLYRERLVGLEVLYRSFNALAAAEPRLHF